jgi:hypothetical protein
MKKGDRVRALQDCESRIKKGWEGIIESTNGTHISVFWDLLTNGHSCATRNNKIRSGWNVSFHIIEVVGHKINYEIY